MEENIPISSPGDPEKAEPSPEMSIGEHDAPVIILKHADRNDADEAMMAFAGHEGETIVMTPEMEKKLLWKIDLNMMPV